MLYPPGNRHPFYYPEYIKYFLGKLTELDLSKMSFEQLTKIIRDAIKSVPIVGSTIKAGTYLARARTSNDGNPFKQLSQITLRDKSLVTSYGRAHKPGQAIFYCSTNDHVAIREATQWQITDFGVLISRNMLGSYHPYTKFVTVSVWEVVEDLTLATLFFDQQAMTTNPIVEDVGARIKNENLNKLEPEISNSTKQILEFFSNEFAKKEITNERDYWLAAYYANEAYLMSRMTKKIDGVIYPSVAMDYQGENIAITEDAYRKKLNFVKAYHNYVANIEIQESPVVAGSIYETVGLVNNELGWVDVHTGETLSL